MKIRRTEAELFCLDHQVESGALFPGLRVVLGDQAGVPAHVHQDVNMGRPAGIGRRESGCQTVASPAVGAQ